MGRETGRSARAKKKKKKCGRLQKIIVVLCKGDDSVRLKFCVNGGGSAGFC